MNSNSILTKLLLINRRNYYVLKKEFISNYRNLFLKLCDNNVSRNVGIDVKINLYNQENIFYARLVKLIDDENSEIILVEDKTSCTTRISFWDRSIPEQFRINIFLNVLENIKSNRIDKDYFKLQIQEIENNYSTLLLSMEDLIKTIFYIKSNKKWTIRFKNKYVNECISGVFISDNIVFIILQNEFSTNLLLVKQFSDLSYYDQCTIVNKLLSILNEPSK